MTVSPRILSSNLGPNICWVVALKSEAKPLISFFKLDLQSGNNIFPIYKNDKLRYALVISGVGQVNAAAATAFLASKTNVPPWAAWINLGIAGSADGEIGKIYQGIKVRSPDKNKIFFPGYRFAKILELMEIQTVDRPCPSVKNGVLHDMEASAFVDVATRFSCNELTFSFKVVSDITETDMTFINKELAGSLIEVNLHIIQALLLEIDILTQLEKQRLQVPAEIEEILGKFNFSVSRQNQLIRKFKKWRVVFPTRTVDDLIDGSKTAKDVLKYLDNHLTDLKFNWIAKID